LPALLNSASHSLTAQSDPGFDEFVVGSGTSLPIELSGTSGVALSSAFNWYLKYVCNNSISWGWNGTGDALVLPQPLPLVSAAVHMKSPVLYRYYMNVCTVSYSMAWWDWSRWEREIDWMAMNGINLPLAFTGQELIWAQLFMSYNLTEADLDAFFAGAGFLAWGRMGNIQAWGGPLSPSWRADQAQLQLQILQRSRSLGMKAVLPAFAGFVPEGLQRVFPNAKYIRSSPWNNFNATYTGVYLLDPSDPLFVEIGKRFTELVTAAFGTDHIYNGDTFNEMDPSTGDPTYLRTIGAAVYQGLIASDPDAVWLMQGWLFHSGFWTDDRIHAYLSGVPDDRLIVLDLNTEAAPIWQRLGGKRW
jgi:alpha-N-acetylglucosaminidase